MASWRHRSSPEEREQTWVGFVKFLLIALFAMLLFLLVESMVRHHFFSGGSLNNHQGHSVGP